jgi:hypothetical protein
VSSASDPAAGASAVTLDADVTPPNSNSARALWVGAAGNVAVRTSLNEDVTFVGVAAGSVLPVRIRRVLSSGTTVAASAMLFLY